MDEQKSFPQQYRVACHTDHIGPGSTFVAIKGMKLDGTQYISEALARGATKVVIEEGMNLDNDLRSAIEAHHAELLVVPSTRLALAQLSAQAYDYPARSLKLLAITGTKGKTTTAFLVEHILKAAGFKTALLSTVENHIGNQTYATDLTTPQPDYLHFFFDQCRSQGVEYVVMETSAQAFSLQRLATLTFDAAAFTNFSLEHSEFYPTQDDYFNAKLELFKQLDSGARVIINADDPRVAACASMVKNPILISVNSHVQSGDIQAHNVPTTGRSDLSARIIQSDLSALALEVHLGKSIYTCTSKALLGAFSAYNVLTAIALIEPYGVSPELIQAAIASFSGVPGRLNRFDLPNKAVAFIDNAHTPSSFEAILSALRPLSKDLTVIFGAGGDRDAIKRPLMGSIAAQYADTTILTTDNPRSEDPVTIIEQIKGGIPASAMSKVMVILDREEAIRKAYELSKAGSIIALLGKGPVEYQHAGDVKTPFSEAAILRSF